MQLKHNLEVTRNKVLLFIWFLTASVIAYYFSRLDLFSFRIWPWGAFTYMNQTKILLFLVCNSLFFLAYLMVSARFKEGVLFFICLMNLLVFNSLLLALHMLLAAICVYFVSSKIHALWLKILSALFVIFIPAILPWFDINWLGNSSRLLRHGQFVAMGIGVKTILYLVDTHAGNVHKNNFRRTLIYFWFPSCQLILPYLAILPSYNYFWSSVDFGISWRIPKHALRNTCYFLGGILGVYLLKQIQALTFMQQVTSVLLLKNVFNLLILWGYYLATAGFAVLFMNLWGIDIHPAAHPPMKMRNLFSLFEQFAPYLREYCARIFYFPTTLLLRKISIELNIIISLLVTLCVGMTTIHLTKYAFLFPGHPWALNLVVELAKAGFLMAGVIVLFEIIRRLVRRSKIRQIRNPFLKDFFFPALSTIIILFIFSHCLYLYLS